MSHRMDLASGKISRVQLAEIMSSSKKSRKFWKFSLSTPFSQQSSSRSRSSSPPIQVEANQQFEKNRALLKKSKQIVDFLIIADEFIVRRLKISLEHWQYYYHGKIYSHPLHSLKSLTKNELRSALEQNTDEAILRCISRFWVIQAVVQDIYQSLRNDAKQSSQALIRPWYRLTDRVGTASTGAVLYIPNANPAREQTFACPYITDQRSYLMQFCMNDELTENHFAVIPGYVHGQSMLQIIWNYMVAFEAYIVWCYNYRKRCVYHLSLFAGKPTYKPTTKICAMGEKGMPSFLDAWYNALTYSIKLCNKYIYYFNDPGKLKILMRFRQLLHPGERIDRDDMSYRMYFIEF